MILLGLGSRCIFLDFSDQSEFAGNSRPKLTTCQSGTPHSLSRLRSGSKTRRWLSTSHFLPTQGQIACVCLYLLILTVAAHFLCESWEKTQIRGSKLRSVRVTTSWRSGPEAGRCVPIVCGLFPPKVTYLILLTYLVPRSGLWNWEEMGEGSVEEGTATPDATGIGGD